MFGEAAKTILIAEDVAINRKLLANIFKDEFNVVEAENGAQALKKLDKANDISVLVLDIVMPELDGFGVLEAMRKSGAIDDIPVIVVTALTDEATQIKAINAGASEVITKPFSPQIVLHRVKNVISRRQIERTEKENRAMERELVLTQIDELSGLDNKWAFKRKLASLLKKNPDGRYVIARWDIDNLKVLNEVYGLDAADGFFKGMGDFYRDKGSKINGLKLYARYDADGFICLFDGDGFDPMEHAKYLESEIARRKTIAFSFIVRLGAYPIDDKSIDISLMCDRALMAMRSIKNNFVTRAAWYDASVSEALIEEQTIMSEASKALEEGEFVVYYQPRYDYDTARLCSAEALVRWAHPTKGLLAPGKFISTFEKNGYISRLDEYVWEKVCAMQRK